MLLKTTILIAMLLGLVTYAYSAQSSESAAPNAQCLENALLKAGYLQINTLAQPGGRSVETFELRSITRPYSHTTCSVQLTIRDDRVVGMSHYSPFDERPDQ